MQDLNSSTKTLMNFVSELCMKVLHRLYIVHALAVLGNPDLKKNLSLESIFFKIKHRLFTVTQVIRVVKGWVGSLML